MKSPQAQNGHLKITRALLTAWTQTPNWEYSVVRGKIIGLVRETWVNCRMGGGDNVPEWSARRTRNPAIPGSIESLWPRAKLVVGRPEFKPRPCL